jgi:molybdopterin-guanine dinucleotide biosynthesis protein A
MELTMVLGVAILTGGTGSRMGADKAAILWGRKRAIDRVAALAETTGAGIILTVGTTNYGLPLVLDHVPRGGPTGGVLAGGAALRGAGCDRMLVLAVDAPTIRPGDIGPLLSVGGPGATYDGLHLPIVVDIAALPSDAQANWPLWRLADQAGLVRIACPAPARARLRGANTPEERSVLLAQLEAAEDGWGSAGD